MILRRVTVWLVGMADEGLLASWRRMFGPPRVRSSPLPGTKVSKPKAMASFAVSSCTAPKLSALQIIVVQVE